MNIAILALIGWIPLSALLFAAMKPVEACTVTFLVGWLALPMAKLPVPGLPDIDKQLASSLGAAAGSVLFSIRYFSGLRLHIADVAVLVFAASTAVTSMVNELGPNDAISTFVRQLLVYGCPFLFGRAFLRNPEDLLGACRIIVTGAAIYALFALWEWRMSPQIHRMLYGFFQHSWLLNARWGFYRPLVCFPANLALGGFFAWTALMAYWMYRARLLKPVLGVPTGALVALPVVGLVTSMSFGPWGMFAGGVLMLMVWQRTKLKRVALIPVVFSLFWMVGRYTGYTDGEWLGSAVSHLSEVRASSLQYRIDAETLFIDHAKERPMFGWGSWGRNRVTDSSGRDLIAADGLWIIYLSAFGLAGVVTFFLWWLIPLAMGFRLSGALVGHPVIMVILVACGLQCANFLFNAFIDPVLTMLCGGVVTQLSRMRSELRWRGRGYLQTLQMPAMPMGVQR